MISLLTNIFQNCSHFQTYYESYIMILMYHKQFIYIITIQYHYIFEITGYDLILEINLINEESFRC